MENQTFEAFVHKSAFSLMKNETISTFQELLRKAATASVNGVFNLSRGDDLYAAEIFSDSVVFSLYRSSESMPNSRYEDRQKYYKVPYTRDKSGAFSFGKPVEVIRVTNFEPVKTNLLSVSKSSVSPEEQFEKVSKSMWKGVSLFKGVI